MGKHVKFDQSGYLNGIKRSLLDELRGVEQLILGNLHDELGTIELRRVDAKYKAEIVNSVNSLVYQYGSKTVASFGAGGEKGQQNQAFRAVYYEYGTGNLMEPPYDWSPKEEGWGNWNMARRGLDIYQRPRGSWVDLGGNVHQSKIKGAPRQLPNSPGSYGEEIRASHWFSKAMLASIGLIDDAVRRAVKKVPIASYIGIRSITKRM